jgi:hypothetical protein
MFDKPTEASLKISVFCTFMLGSCLPHMGYVITACARAGGNQLNEPP